jgi:hypothetical protein
MAISIFEPSELSLEKDVELFIKEEDSTKILELPTHERPAQPPIELKPLPSILRYAFLNGDIESLVIIMLSVKTRRRAVTGNTRSREASGTAGGPWSLGQRPSNPAYTLAWSR